MCSRRRELAGQGPPVLQVGDAVLFGKALSTPQGHTDTADAAEIRAITDAMVRLLIGAPLHSDGKLTIVCHPKPDCAATSSPASTPA
jgi:hypothetical protein